MTRKEERKQAAKEYGCLFYGPFLNGAEWADKTMIDKAVKWLEENADKYLINTWGGTGYVPKCSIRLFSEFRKAMEE